MNDETMMGLATLVQTARALGVPMDAPHFNTEVIKRAKELVAERDKLKALLKEALPCMGAFGNIKERIERVL